MKPDDKTAAAHEAGHAVVAYALRHCGVEAWLGEEPPTVWFPWENQLAERRHKLIITMAEPESVAMRFGECFDHLKDALRDGYSTAEIERARRVAQRLLRTAGQRSSASPVRCWKLAAFATTRIDGR